MERVFSLYRPDSALTHLNRTGELSDPPLDMVRLLTEARRFSRISDGAFDVTVQLLWQLYAEHFARPGADLAGPPPAAVEAVLSLVDYRALRVEEGRISFARRGMAATLNGIAQGYVTDRVADRLRAEGMTSVLVDIGEILAIGHHPGGRAWRVGLRGRVDDAGTTEMMEISDAAVATTSGQGTALDPAGRFGHIFDPLTGQAATQPRVVTATARDATTADALPTMLAVMSLEHVMDIRSALPGVARITQPGGTVITLGGPLG